MAAVFARVFPRLIHGIMTVFLAQMKACNGPPLTIRSHAQRTFTAWRCWKTLGGIGAKFFVLASTDFPGPPPLNFPRTPEAGS